MLNQHVISKVIAHTRDKTVKIKCWTIWPYFAKLFLDLSPNLHVKIPTGILTKGCKYMSPVLFKIQWLKYLKMWIKDQKLDLSYHNSLMTSKKVWVSGKTTTSSTNSLKILFIIFQTDEDLKQFLNMFDRKINQWTME